MWQLNDATQSDYYWKNFEQILGWVKYWHAELLSSEDNALIEEFFALPLDARKLWLRLSSRKPTWFRSDKLHYADIDNLTQAQQRLCETNWAQRPPLSLADWLQAMTQKELKQFALAQSATITPSATKPKLLKQLASQLAADQTPPFKAIQPLRQQQFQRILWLFFGHSNSDLSELVKTALGHVQYENYTIRPRGIFDSKVALTQFETLTLWQQSWRDASPPQQQRLIAELLLWLKQTTLRPQFVGKCSRLLNSVARQLERQGLFQQALTLYAFSQREPSREREIRCWLKLGQQQQAQRRYQAALEQPQSANETLALQRMGHYFGKPRMRRQQYRAIQQITAPRMATEQLEYWVLQQYQQQGWEGLFGENLLPQAVFGLVFWDIIFADIDSAFCQPFQRGPRDLLSPTFIRKRQRLIARRMRSIQHYPQAVANRIARLVKTKFGIENPFVVWRWAQHHALDSWFKRLAPDYWLAIFNRLLDDIRQYRSGFPDLWLWHPELGTLLVEVKGPKDSLRGNQRHWLAFLAENGLRCGVVDVQFLSTKPS
ncbi:hypothetical protein CWI84_02770 [Idiomarina tyrosinivorans]|uniref:phosphodiesterase I n=1 Tax=Idiomarina tyrosinivorans TaxID=1445662 RepID=A0A432ZT89_9GAMM|nr:VRR-NUC domain-containing protein [Idiomarina tyrosinivorans]RUO81051.1 hypothetical protein CWI84_02770 [Idiomarina tyrosinivorans]